MLNPVSSINNVHESILGEDYSRVSAYLRRPAPGERRSYSPFLGTVLELDDAQRSICFQSECLLPAHDRGRPRLLLLFSNAHPESIRRGMFHTAESGVADLWGDLAAVGALDVADTTLRSPDLLRGSCLEVAYEGSFCLGLACYWTFPTFSPGHLKHLFGPSMEPPGFGDTVGRAVRLIERWRPTAVVSFQGGVFEGLMGRSIRGYTEELAEGLVMGHLRTRIGMVPLFQTYPAAWRYQVGAQLLRRASLRRIVAEVSAGQG
jgi:hypothetical protein